MPKQYFHNWPKWSRDYRVNDLSEYQNTLITTNMQASLVFVCLALFDVKYVSTDSNELQNGMLLICHNWNVISSKESKENEYI